jgi:muramoyltetrapeptide carboxypeptidase
MMRKPYGLNEGDKIALVSPSSGIHPTFNERWQRALEFLQTQFNLNTVVMPNTLITDGSTWATSAGSSEKRAQDIIDAFEDPSIKAILATTGGYVCNEVLDLIDYDIIAANPKILIGFSDITALLLAVSERADLITFYGTTLMSAFGDVRPAEETAGQFRSTLFRSDAPGYLFNFERICTKSPWWGTEDDNSELVYDACERMVGISAFPGQVQGKAVVANFETMCDMGAFLPIRLLDQSILVLEDVGASLGRLRRQFGMLGNQGVLKSLKGIVLGYMPDLSGGDTQDLHNYLVDLGNHLKIPILYNVHFGHYRPFSLVPIGGELNLSSSLEPGMSNLVMSERVTIK